jgi:large subunit ribosomal protein L19
MSKVLNEVEALQLKKDIVDFTVGDSIKVSVQIVEGGKKRIQNFEGVVVSRKNGHGIRGSFTVRKIVSGVGVERTFLLHSPKLAEIAIVRKGKVRRAKLYYLRDLIGSKETRLKEDEAENLNIQQKLKEVKKEKAAQKLADKAAAAGAQAEVKETVPQA